MNSCDLHFPAFNAAAEHARIRWALFAHQEVHDVLPTLHADTLRVRHRGAADAAAWTATLTELGFPAPQVKAAPVRPPARAAAADAAE